MVVNITEEQLYDFNFKQLLEVLEDICEESGQKEAREIHKKVKFGINAKFPINLYLEGNYEEFPNVNKVRVSGLWEWSLQIFRDEINDRKILMRNQIRKYLQVNSGIGTTTEPISFDDEEENEEEEENGRE